MEQMPGRCSRKLASALAGWTLAEKKPDGYRAPNAACLGLKSQATQTKSLRD
jgi:hypothetical protein